jgi:hypothetical protein
MGAAFGAGTRARKVVILASTYTTTYPLLFWSPASTALRVLSISFPLYKDVIFSSIALLAAQALSIRPPRLERALLLLFFPLVTWVRRGSRAGAACGDVVGRSLRASVGSEYNFNAMQPGLKCLIVFNVSTTWYVHGYELSHAQSVGRTLAFTCGSCEVEVHDSRAGLVLGSRQK